MITTKCSKCGTVLSELRSEETKTVRVKDCFVCKPDQEEKKSKIFSNTTDALLFAKRQYDGN